MTAKFFMLYGSEKSLTAHVTDIGELMGFATRLDSTFKPELRGTQGERVRDARAILETKYPIFDLFDYTPEGMAAFIEAAADNDELVGLAALELGQEYIEECQKALNAAFGIAQSAAIERVQFPVAGDTQGFSEYIDTISEIRAMSIKGLYEYVENGDKPLP